MTAAPPDLELSQDAARARLARWHTGHDPAALWPSLAPPAIRTALRAIAEVTGRVLRGDATPVSLAPPGDARAAGVAAFLSGMGPLLGYWIERGAVRASHELAELLVLHLEHGRARAELLGRHLTDVVRAFRARGVDAVALKGAHTARAYFPDPGTRPMTDIDILVAPGDAGRARALLATLGFEETGPEHLPHRSTWTPPNGARTPRSLELTHADNPWTLDLHTTLDREFARGPTARFGDPTDLADATWPDVAERVRVLGGPLLLAYLAAAAAHDFPDFQLIRVVELALVVRRDYADDGEAWRTFEAFVAQRRLERFVYPALAMVERLVPGAVDPGVHVRLAAAAPPRLQHAVRRTALHAQRVGGPSLRESLAIRLMWAASPAELLATFGDLIWPRQVSGPLPLRRFLAKQGARLRQLVREALGGKR